MWHLAESDYVITVDDDDVPDPVHSHHALQLSFALDGHVVLDLPDSAGLVRAVSVAVAPDVPHRVDRPAVTYMCEPESERGRLLLGALAGATYTTWPAERVGVPLHLDADAAVDEVPERVRSWVLATVDRLLDGVTPARPVDVRIQRVLDDLVDLDGRPRPLIELAAIAQLSPDRLRHLFVDEVGIPIRKYAVWRRTVAALRSMVLDDCALTAVAHDTGFADQAALSRTHRSLFGRTPSAFAQEAVRTR